jgi:hypothetical protein
MMVLRLELPAAVTENNPSGLEPMFNIAQSQKDDRPGRSPAGYDAPLVPRSVE